MSMKLFMTVYSFWFVRQKHALVAGIEQKRLESCTRHPNVNEFFLALVIAKRGKRKWSEEEKRDSNKAQKSIKVNASYLFHRWSKSGLLFWEDFFLLFDLKLRSLKTTVIFLAWQFGPVWILQAQKRSWCSDSWSANSTKLSNHDRFKERYRYLFSTF